MSETQPEGLVAIVLVNWNGGRYLEACLASVMAQTYPHIELTVIDNASIDASPDWLAKHHPQIRLVRNTANVGFARAQNAGISMTRGEYYMPLNFDVELEPGFVDALVRLAESRPEAGSFSGKLLQLGEDGGRTDVLDSTGHVLRKTRTAENRGYGERDAGQYETVDEVFGVSGTAPLYRRAMLEDVRLEGEFYDESYFAYWEDVDLDWRAQHAGWKALYCPDAVGYHYRSGGRDPRDIAVRLTYRNRYLTIAKNDSAFDLLRHAPYIAAYEAHRLLQMIIDPDFRHLWNMWPSTLRQMVHALRRRRIIRAGRRRRGTPAPPSRLFLGIGRQDMPGFLRPRNRRKPQ